MTGMSPRAIFATDLAKGWRPWGIFVPVLGLIFVAMTVASFTACCSMLIWWMRQKIQLDCKGSPPSCCCLLQRSA